MNNVSHHSRPDTHGAEHLPRTRALIASAVHVGLFALSSDHEATAVTMKTRFGNVSPNQRDAITAISRQAADTQAVGYPSSVGEGQVITGLTSLTLLGRLSGAVDVAIRTSIPYLGLDNWAGGTIVGAGQPIKVLGGEYGRAAVDPVKAAAIIAVSRELLEQPSAEAGLQARLLRAATAAADAEFIRLALGGDSAIASGAQYPSELLVQVRAMASALIAEGANPATITLAASPATLLLLATTVGFDGHLAFPTITVNGGTLAGMPILVSHGIADGRIVAIAGDTVLRAPVVPRIEASRNASIEMADNPTGAAPPETNPTDQSRTTVQMLQVDLVALRIVLEFGVDFMSDTPAAFIDGVTLDGLVPSPATA